VFERVERLVEASDALEGVGPKAARCLHLIVPDVQLLLEGTTAREVSRAERPLGQDHRAQSWVASEEGSALLRDLAFQNHVGVDEDEQVAGCQFGAAVPWSRPLRTRLDENVGVAPCDVERAVV